MSMASAGLPGFANFVSELLVIVGAWHQGMYVPAILATSGRSSSPASTCCARSSRRSSGAMPRRWERLEDARTPFQRMPFVLLASVLLLFGFWPQPLLSIISQGVDPIVASLERAPGRRPDRRREGTQVTVDLHLGLLLPEILLVLGGLAAVTVDLLVGCQAREPRPVGGGARARRGAARARRRAARRAARSSATGRSDAFSRFVRAIACGGGALLVLVSAAYTRRMDRGHGEFYGLLLFAILGVLLVSGVTDLMGMFVSLELVTITSYVLAAFKRNDVRSTEAGLKYLVVGAVSSAMLLFGIALVYGASGTVDFEIALLPRRGQGLLAAARARDGPRVRRPVLQGVGRPVPGVGARRLPGRSLPGDRVPDEPLEERGLRPAAPHRGGARRAARSARRRGDGWLQFFAVVAGLTLLYGNLGAIPQKDVKRLLAYSSIGHAGYMLLGVVAIVAAPDEVVRRAGATAVLVYLLAYYLTTITAFAVVVRRLGPRTGPRRGHGLRGAPPALAAARARAAPGAALARRRAADGGPDREVPRLLRARGRRGRRTRASWCSA